MWKEMRNSFILLSVFYILFGAVLFVWPALSARAVCMVIGIFALAYGVMRIVEYIRFKDRMSFFGANLAVGIIMALCGVFLLIRPEVLMAALPIVFGVIILFNGIIELQRAFDLKRFGYEGWWYTLLLSVLTIILGILIFWNPFVAVQTTVMAIGIILAVTGVTNLITGITASRNIRRLKKEYEDMEDKFGPFFWF
ncbi:HdeD family acid-resistance protein [Lachnotalea sp. AF33-28]|jgi:uncharacterized membrane protein HdeD (DUF308 family)|uniref:HdeD family acid-resistance protein n=1 Tax=Lachnotalea sp. AF33-28 TaxID=2292046 RepID=UPI000E494EB7|nr:DUF308 domain-containing protein [Lachnotalea sp. AF33-28]RHP31276.1 hypothetical protein DWZ56_17045 [Lachnotalea sp. AF33-28]